MDKLWWLVKMDKDINYLSKMLLNLIIILLISFIFAIAGIFLYVLSLIGVLNPQDFTNIMGGIGLFGLIYIICSTYVLIDMWKNLSEKYIMLSRNINSKRNVYKDKEIEEEDKDSEDKGKEPEKEPEYVKKMREKNRKLNELREKRRKEYLESQDYKDKQKELEENVKERGVIYKKVQE